MLEDARKEFMDAPLDNGDLNNPEVYRNKKTVTIQNENATDNYSQAGKSVKSGFTLKSSQKKSSKSKSSKPKPALTKEEREMEARRSRFNNTTRWLADSSFTTYFGKPAFHPYGRANTKPT